VHTAGLWGAKPPAPSPLRLDNGPFTERLLLPASPPVSLQCLTLHYLLRRHWEGDRAGHLAFWGDGSLLGVS
jgi:hypothetical protein